MLIKLVSIVFRTLALSFFAKEQDILYSSNWSLHKAARKRLTNSDFCRKEIEINSNVVLFCSMEQRTLKNVNNCLNTNIYSYLETSRGQSSNPYLNVVHFFQHQHKLEICGSLG
jgi:hypothetical protein